MHAMLAQTVVVAFVVSLAAAALLLSRFGRAALDRPNERSLHRRPVPRTGGVAMIAGAGCAIALNAGELWPAMLPALVLAAVSFVDDLRSLPAALRLACHFAAAGFVCWYLLSPMHPAELALLVLAVVWLANLFNFMDGSDGLAGGMALIGFGAYAGAALIGGQLPLAAGCLALAAASAAFLVYNFPPARIFLGDAGSIPLGFLAGALGITGWRDDLWPLWFPLFVFAPFVGDATLTLLRRLLRRERVWQAHREHYYQRLVRMGIGHAGTAIFAYALMMLCVASAFGALAASGALRAAILGVMVALLAATAVWIEVRWARDAARPRAPAQR
jgi:UDP-N-acetylmuramyl pentapeptide phosphotransferase/UDP-N-acetylglucosamine-1-phosphate transferase